MKPVEPKTETRNPLIHVVMVCEVFSELKRLGNSTVALVGRMEMIGGLIDHYEFVSQEHCDKPLVTQGSVWPTKVLILPYWEEGMPKHPTDESELDRAALAEKLSVVRKNTTLGFHKDSV
jgi:hypothetical protein